MPLFKKLRNKLSGYTDSDIAEANKLSKQPRISKIRHGTGPKIQHGTFKVLLEYAKNKRVRKESGSKNSPEQKEIAKKMNVKLS